VFIQESVRSRPAGGRLAAINKRPSGPPARYLVK
jgi:hypothetical protein